MSSDNQQIGIEDIEFRKGYKVLCSECGESRIDEEGNCRKCGRDIVPAEQVGGLR